MTPERLPASPGVVALVTGASGQDGSILTQRLLAGGAVVHVLARDAQGVGGLPAGQDEVRRLHTHVIDLRDVDRLQAIVRQVRPDELYNLAGMSSVSASFADPWVAWETNARPVVAILEAIREGSPDTRFYQASSSEMFGGPRGEIAVRDEDSPLQPQSPYAAAKAAAHLACQVFRDAFDLRVACGIAFNHESSRRPASFLTRKVVDHVRRLQSTPPADRLDEPPLRMGNLSVQRDWGSASDYVDGMILIARQIEVRAAVLQQRPEADVGSSYRDYILGTGRLHAVWQLVDRAFALGGFELEWQMPDGDPPGWRARFRDTGRPAVTVDPALLRPADPIAIQADPGSALRELGWAPRVGLDVFLSEMFSNGA